ncbi:MAG: GumC family protein [Alphaproteobacteria bacterium]
MNKVTPFPRSPLPAQPEIVLPMASNAPQGLNLRQLLNILRRRIVLILGIVVLVTGAVALGVNQIVPLYQAEAQVVVEGNRERLVKIDSVVQGINPDYFTNETEAAIISSTEMAERVVRHLDLSKHPQFNPELAPPSRGAVAELRSAAWSWITGTVLVPLGLAAAPEAEEPRPVLPAAPEERERELVRYAVPTLLGGLRVVPSERSRVISIRFSSTDPQIAALAANGFADVYIKSQLSQKGEATDRAGDWLSTRVTELGQRVVEAERRHEDFRRKSGIIEVGGANILAQQIASLNTELVVARTKRAESEARFQQVQRLAVEARGGLESSAFVLDSSLIQNLRSQESGIQRKIAELRTQVRDQHPKMILAQSELADLRQKIAEEVQKIGASLGNELQIARVRESNLQNEVNRLQARVLEQNQSEVKLRALESEVRATKQLYETFLARLKETKVQEDAQQPDARIINRASVPGAPFYPRKNLAILTALLAAALLGVAVALLLEYLDSGFRSLSQLEQTTGVGTLGIVPLVKQPILRNRPLHEVLLERPHSVFSESIRTLRTGLMLSDVNRPPRSVLFTSSIPGEGKSSTTLALAMMAAKSGQRVIVLDCDLRHPNLHALLGVKNGKGLSDYLAGNSTLEDVIEIDTRSGVHYVTAGSRAPNPSDILGSAKMRALIQSLSRLYDLVALDTPPVMAVADALVLVRAVDKTVFLVRWAKTRRETVTAAMRMVLEAGADMPGTVMCQVDTTKQARYDYYDSGYYYYGKNRKYYAD